jgi:hypothetical protein
MGDRSRGVDIGDDIESGEVPARLSPRPGIPLLLCLWLEALTEA